MFNQINLLKPYNTKKYATYLIGAGFLLMIIIAFFIYYINFFSRAQDLKSDTANNDLAIDTIALELDINQNILLTEFSLDQLTFNGVISFNNDISNNEIDHIALLSTPDQVIYQVKSGDTISCDHAQILDITNQYIKIQTNYIDENDILKNKVFCHYY